MPRVCQGACVCNRSFSSSAFSFFHIWSALPCRKVEIIFCVWDIELWGDCWWHHLSSILKVFLLIRIRVDEKFESVFSAIKITWQQRAKFSTEWEIRLFVHVRESIVSTELSQLKHPSVFNPKGSNRNLIYSGSCPLGWDHQIDWNMHDPSFSLESWQEGCLLEMKEHTKKCRSQHISQCRAASRFSGNVVESVNVQQAQVVMRRASTHFPQPMVREPLLVCSSACLNLTHGAQQIYPHLIHSCKHARGSLIEDLRWSLKPPMEVKNDCTLREYRISSCKYSHM